MKNFYDVAMGSIATAIFTVIFIAELIVLFQP
jgi:hypothetical protein